jgi:hypothetical protein
MRAGNWVKESELRSKNREGEAGKQRRQIKREEKR